MKKALVVLLMTALLICGFSVFASAGFGVGIEVMVDGVEMIKTGLTGQKLCFTDTDFKTALGVRDFKEVTVTRLPASEDGTLMLGERRLAEGQSIRRRNIGSLTFTPASSDITETSFEFKVDDLCGGEAILCTLKFIDRINYAPTVEGITEDALSYTTQRDISLHGRLSAEDKEGDELEFIIVSYPKSGELTLGDDGESFRYTPKADFSGSDEFVYVARDEYGNFSRPAKVSLKVTERMSEVVYVDMIDSKSYNASVVMTGMGIMSGKRVGDDMYFMPEECVTRAEFVAMAMKALGMSADKSLTESFFDDNADIPKSLVSYVATAQRAGVVNGSFEKTGLYFRPNDTITRYEAAIVMANLIDASDLAASAGVVDITSVPVFARGQYGAMCALGIFDGEGGGVKDEVTREDACEYLYRLSLSYSK
ncbi:MAG: cadherin-like domain-containing protein [Clostridia bacterium]|nr:cadherin-like domain-containing protein [Clostridia bacterium]